MTNPQNDLRAMADLRELILQFGPLRGARLTGNNLSTTAVSTMYCVERCRLHAFAGGFNVIAVTATPPYKSYGEAHKALAVICEHEARVNVARFPFELLEEVQNHILHDRWPFDLPPPERS